MVGLIICARPGPPSPRPVGAPRLATSVPLAVAAAGVPRPVPAALVCPEVVVAVGARVLRPPTRRPRKAPAVPPAAAGPSPSSEAVVLQSQSLVRAARPSSLVARLVQRQLARRPRAPLAPPPAAVKEPLAGHVPRPTAGAPRVQLPAGCAGRPRASAVGRLVAQLVGLGFTVVDKPVPQSLSSVVLRAVAQAAAQAALVAAAIAVAVAPASLPGLEARKNGPTDAV